MGNGKEMVSGLSFVPISHFPSPILGAVCLLFAASGGLCPPPARAADDTAARASAIYDGIVSEALPNGLRVYLKPVPGAPTVTTLVAYKVGSADEELDQTGLSHYLEHLMFKGTDKLFPGDIDRLTQRNGGRNNAYTSEDMTVYHFDFASDRWEAALGIEADRMRNLRIDARHEFEQEKGAVISELKGNEDDAWELEYKAILPLLFGDKSPYGHPVIGQQAHVEGATAEVIKAHYDRWYHPNNAALVICGGFDPERALARVRELFGPIPAGKLPPRKDVVKAGRDGPVRKEIVSKFDVPRMVMGFNGVAAADADADALDVLEGVLAGGKTGRLYRKLVEEERIAGGVEGTNTGGRYPGWFSVQVELLKGRDRARAEDLVLAELARLAAEPPTDAELRRVKRGLAAKTVFGSEGIHELGDHIARAVTTDGLGRLRGYLSRIDAVSGDEVRRVAAKYLDARKRVVVWSVPADRGPRPAGRDAKQPQRSRAPAAATAYRLTDAKRRVLPNGLTLLLLENHRLPIVVAEALVKNARLYEPADKSGIATLAGNLLEEGAAGRSGPEISRLIEDVGGELSLAPTGGSVKVLAADRSLGLGLFLDCLTKPTFPADAFDRVREQQLTRIDDAKTDPQQRASEAFRVLVYGDHPLGRPPLGSRESVEKLTRADCAAFHRRVFVPNNTILAIVGDFDADAVAAEVEKLTAGWAKGELPAPDLSAPPKPAGFVQKVISMPNAAQLHMYLGHLGVRRSDPDWYTLLVMDNVLGTGPGFTDRLSATLRDREGLAYTVTATIATGAGEEPGLFSGYIGTFPDKFARVKKGFLDEIVRIRAEPPTATEVEDAKKYLLGSLPFRLSGSESVAAQLISAERFGLGLDALEEYRKKVASVTPADVQAVARKHLDPARLVLVAAGPVDAAGKPLAAAGE
jgi:zinc protease